MMELNQLLDGMTWEDLMRLRQQQEQGGQQGEASMEAPMQLAQLSGGMGMTPAIYAAQEAARQAATQAPPVARWNPGKDDQMTQDWRARQATGQAAERDRLMRMQQERARSLRQQGG